MGMIPALKEIKDIAPIKSEDLNSEYDFIITKVLETKSNRTGRYGCLLIIKFADMDYAADIMHTLWYGNYGDYNGDDEDKSNLMWRMVKEFLRSLGFDPEEETDFEDLLNYEFTAEISYNSGFTTDDDGNEVKVGPPKNEIVRIL